MSRLSAAMAMTQREPQPMPRLTSTDLSPSLLFWPRVSKWRRRAVESTPPARVLREKERERRKEEAIETDKREEDLKKKSFRECPHLRVNKKRKNIYEKKMKKSMSKGCKTGDERNEFPEQSLGGVVDFSAARA